MIYFVMTWMVVGALFTCGPTALGLVVGSDSSVSRQAHTLFPAADSDNKILGFATMANGFALEDATTTCIYDAFMPIKNRVQLNGGTLLLNQDLIFQSRLTFFSDGVLDGQQGCSLAFPSFNFDFLNEIEQLQDVDTTTQAVAVNSLGWSFDDKYVAVGLNKPAGDDIRIYYFDDVTLTATHGADIDEKTYAVKWHPTQHFLATGHEKTADEVRIYRLNVSNGSFTKTGGYDTGDKSVYALAWHQTGAFLVSGDANDQLRLHSFDDTNGTIALDQTIALSNKFLKESLSWSPGGNFLVSFYPQKQTRYVQNL